ncbi:MAG: ribonuclease J [Eubacteriales bacterium]
MEKSNKRNNNGKQKTEDSQVSRLRIIPLGGIGEIGKNLTVYEYEDDMIVVDCGLMFPTEEMLGVDYVIPDATYLTKNLEKLRGIFLTHGHEDHIGAIPYLADKLHVPIYGTALTIALVEAKLVEHPIEKPDLKVVKADDKIIAGKFSVEFIRVSHSIDDAVAFAIKTPIGTVVHTGDFKMDLTPVGGKVINLSRFAELGKNGVLALLSDSTNAERPGFNISESNVGETFIHYFKQAKGRIIVATFASNVSRLQQVIDTAKIYNKKLCLSGRSMIKIVNVTRELGSLNLDDDMLIGMEELKNYKDNQIVILSTGSQGETMSSLVRMATGQHAKLNIKQGDLVILSATPIPGNERYVYDVVNMLYRKGATVINDATDRVHVSGHACEEELKLMLTLVQPKYFIPVHGEYRHLYKHAALAERMGIKKINIFIPEIGMVLEFTRKTAMIGETVPAGSVFIDGLGVGDVGNVVLRDRKQLSSDGLFIIVVTVSKDKGELLMQPDIISRGFVYMRESEDLLENSRVLVTEIVEKCYNSDTSDWSTLKNSIRKEINRYLYNKTKRNPMILPIIIEI